MNPGDSSDRQSIDFVLFGLGFLGFLIAATGIVVTSPHLALAGGLLFFLVVLSFWLRANS